jgi:hypothetical protein
MSYRERAGNGYFINKCSKCRKDKELKSQRYCRKCKNEYTAIWRKAHPLTKEQKFKNNVRSKKKMRIKRGLLIPLPCEKCGEKKVEAHHDDYKKAYCVRWLCFKCHRNHHKEVYEENKRKKD